MSQRGWCGTLNAMSRTRPKPYWWHWKIYAYPGKTSRRLQRKGDRSVRKRETSRLIDEQR